MFCRTVTPPSLPRHTPPVRCGDHLRTPNREVPMTRPVRTASAFLLFPLAAAASYAKFETASVVGTVRDTSGGVVPDAMVTLTNAGTSVSMTRKTTGDGLYEFVTVRPGTYVV